MSTRPQDDPLARLQNFINAASGPPAPRALEPLGGDDALARVQSLIERANRERAWPPPLSGILTSLYLALTGDLPLDAPADLADTPSLVAHLATSSGAEPVASRAPAPTASSKVPAPTPLDPAPERPPEALDRTAELLLAAIATRPLDGPSRSIVARLLTEALAERDWDSARRALEIVVTGG